MQHTYIRFEARSTQDILHRWDAFLLLFGRQPKVSVHSTVLLTDGNLCFCDSSGCKVTSVGRRLVSIQIHDREKPETVTFRFEGQKDPIFVVFE